MSPLKRPLRALGFGILLWFIPFVAGMVLYPLYLTNRPLFDSLISVALTGAIVLCTWLYLKKIPALPLRAALLLGLLWIIICILLDLLFFLYGPPQMTFFGYLREIGVAYLSIPIITIGASYIRRNER